MTSQLFERKVKTLFVRFDLNQSGTIDEEDFEHWSDRLISFGNLSPSQQVTLRVKIKQLWKVYFAPADRDGDGQIELAELLDYIKAIVNDSGKQAVLEETLPLIFDAIDVDKDGTVSKDEFANYFKSLNINDTNLSEAVFNAMDVNSDQTICRDEFSHFGKRFFTQNVDDASKLFFGPLVD